MWSDWLVVCECGFSLSALWCPLSVPTDLLGFLLPWTWGISSWLLQQSTAAAPYLGRGVGPLGHCPWPWMWSSSLGVLAASTPKPAFSNMWIMNFQIFKLILEKAEEPEIKLSTSAGSSKKQESSRKTSVSALLTMPKPLTVWITTNCVKFWRRWEYQTTWPAFWETCTQVKKQHLELHMEQQTGSK